MSFGETESSMSLPPGKTQHLLPKSVFDRSGSDRWNLASTTFPDAGPMVRIRFPPAASQQRTVPAVGFDGARPRFTLPSTAAVHQLSSVGHTDGWGVRLMAPSRGAQVRCCFRHSATTGCSSGDKNSTSFDEFPVLKNMWRQSAVHPPKERARIMTFVW